jgi:hypothetical protein
MPTSDELRQTYHDAPDAVLLEALGHGPNAYSQEAWSAIQWECAARGLQARAPASGLATPVSPQDPARTPPRPFPEYLALLAMSAGYVGLVMQIAIIAAGRPPGTHPLQVPWSPTVALAGPSLVAIVVSLAFRDTYPRTAKAQLIAGITLLVAFVLFRL